MKHIFFLILTTLALLGCNTQKKGQNLSLFCYVRYDESAKAIKAEASVQDSDKKISVEMPGGFRYQGVEMKLIPIVGLTYRYEYSAAFTAEHIFDWRNAKNEKNQVRLKLDPIKKFSLPAETISNSKPTVVSWEGVPLGKGETIVFMWENNDKGLTVPMEVSTTSGAPYIDIPAAKLQDIVPGNWTLYLVRKKLSKDTVDNMQVNSILEYYTSPIAVKVTQ